MNRVRVIRILEYEGPEDWVKATLDKSVVRGKWELSPGRSIRETVGPMIPVPEGEAEPPGGRRGPVVADHGTPEDAPALALCLRGRERQLHEPLLG